MKVIKLRSDEEFEIHYDEKPILTHKTVKPLLQLKQCGMNSFINTTFDSLRLQSEEGVSIEPIDIKCIKTMVSFFHEFNSLK